MRARDDRRMRGSARTATSTPFCGSSRADAEQHARVGRHRVRRVRPTPPAGRRARSGSTSTFSAGRPTRSIWKRASASVIAIIRARAARARARRSGTRRRGTGRRCASSTRAAAHRARRRRPRARGACARCPRAAIARRTRRDQPRIEIARRREPLVRHARARRRTDPARATGRRARGSVTSTPRSASAGSSVSRWRSEPPIPRIRWTWTTFIGALRHRPNAHSSAAAASSAIRKSDDDAVARRADEDHRGQRLVREQRAARAPTNAARADERARASPSTNRSGRVQRLRQARGSRRGPTPSPTPSSADPTPCAPPGRRASPSRRDGRARSRARLVLVVATAFAHSSTWIFLPSACRCRAPPRVRERMPGWVA